MAAAVVERAWRPSTPDAVERDLAALWRDLSQHGAIARAVMSNLVVFRLRERRSSARRGPLGLKGRDGPERQDGGNDSLDDLIDRVAARHPSRTIVIEHDRGDHDPGQPMGTDVGVSVFGRPTAKYAIEWIVVRSACADASLPSIVRRFVRGDVPTSVWWTEDVSRVPLRLALVETGRQLLYDSRRWRNLPAGIRGVAPLVTSGRVDVADLNWPRLAHLRLALVHASASVPSGVAAGDTQITYRPGEEPLAWLLAGWLAARLGWSPKRWPTMNEGRDDDDVLSLQMGGDAGVLTATLDDHRVRLEQPGAPPLVAAVPRPAEAEAIAAQLRARSTETALRDALTWLSKRIASPG
jgi:glucose-6-phosphate dehydrogenase assembly protein OpcA